MILGSFIFILCFLQNIFSREYVQNNNFVDNCVSIFCSKNRPSGGSWATFSYNDYRQRTNLQNINIWTDSGLTGGSNTSRNWADAPQLICFFQIISSIPADTYQIDFLSFTPNNASAGTSLIQIRLQSSTNTNLYTTSYSHIVLGTIVQSSKKLTIPVSQTNARLIFCNKVSGLTGLTNFRLYSSTLPCIYGQYWSGSQCLTCTSKYSDCVSCDQFSCTVCDQGYNIAGDGTCESCNLAHCTACSSLHCIACESGYFLTSGSCTLCREQFQYSDFCLTCNTIACLSCQAGSFLQQGTCVSCSYNYNQNCLECTDSSCTACAQGYIISNGICQLCSDLYTSCLECDALKCTQCYTKFYWSTENNLCSLCSLQFSNCDTCNPSQCLTCSAGYLVQSGACKLCGDHYPNCVNCNTLECTQCQNSYFLASGSCSLCSSQFSNCDTCNPSQCLTCSAGYLVQSGACKLCGDHYPNCVNCNTLECTQCQNSYFLASGSCSLCSSQFSNCNTCNPSQCLTCIQTFLYEEGQCVKCLADQFLQNDSCFECSQKFNNCNICEASSCLGCSANHYIQAFQCKRCQQKFPNCIRCDNQKCNQCSSGFVLNNVLGCKKSEPTTSGECGDGKIDEGEQCDDNNTYNLDGCDSQCKIQYGFACLRDSDVGVSVCKYTKGIELSFRKIFRHQFENKISLFFNINPNIDSWNTQTISKLITKVQIIKPSVSRRLLQSKLYQSSLQFNQRSLQINQSSIILNQRILQSSTDTVIPYEKIEFIYHSELQENNLEIKITYGEFSLVGCILVLTIDPANTGISIIDTVSLKKITLDFNNPIFDSFLYAYSRDIYEWKKYIQYGAWIVGMIAISMVFLGCILPFGKNIIGFTLSVVQISYFTLISIEKLPLTFYSLEHLKYSNGFNYDFGIIHQINQNTVTGKLGFNGQSFMWNYNISFLVLVVVPFLLSLIALAFLRKQKTQRVFDEFEGGKVQNDLERINKNETANITERNNLILKVLFQGLSLENCLYGLQVTGFLIWVSAFSFISYLGQDNILISQYLKEIVCIVIISLIWIAYFVLLLLVKTQKYEIYISKQRPKSTNSQSTNDKSEQKKSNVSRRSKVQNLSQLTLLSGFGQYIGLDQSLFFNFNHQCCPVSNQRKFFTASMMIQKILFSAIVVFTPQVTPYPSAILLSIYLVYIVMTIWKYPSIEAVDNFSDQNENKKCTNIFSLKTSKVFGLVMILLVQTFYLSLSIINQNTKVQQSQNQLFFTSHLYTMKIIPLLILLISLLGMLFSMLIWIAQIEKNSPLQKAKFWFNFLFNNKNTNITFKNSKRLRMQHTSSVTVQNLNEKTQAFDSLNYPSTSILDGSFSESQKNTSRKTDKPFFKFDLKSQSLNTRNETKISKFKKTKEHLPNGSQLIISQQSSNKLRVLDLKEK